jgi:hypothetical protein
MANRVQALETRLSIAATDPNAAAADTHVDGDPFAEDLGVDNDEHSELPDPPSRQRRPFNRQGTSEFKDFALIWWNELGTLGLQPHTWDGLKTAMRQRFIPPSYQRDLCKKLQRLD